MFARFASGELCDDDEVAQTYDPDTFRVIALPLVRVRVALEIARDQGAVRAEEVDAIVLGVKRHPFGDRVKRLVALCFESCVGRERAAPLTRILDADESDVKRADALSLVARMTGDLATANRGL